MKKTTLSVTIEEGLTTLDNALVINVQQDLLVTSLQAEIERVLTKEFDALGTTLTGAYATHTAIQPLEDNVIELFVLLKPERGQLNTPAELMRHMRDALLKKYSDAEIDVKGHGVNILRENYQFHLVPSFYRQGKGYIIADAKKNLWLKTNPSVHYFALDDDNRKHKGMLVPSVRVVKYWNECNGALFNNYYLELLMKETLADKKIESHVHAVKSFFRRAIKLVVFTIDDPADFGKQMDGLKDINNMLAALQCFIDSHEHIALAEKYESQGNLMMAYKEFGKIFGGAYPSYVDMMAKKLEANNITGIEALQILRDAT